MSRSMVGLLAAVGAAMSALVAFAHGDLVWLVIVNAAVATGLAAYAAAPPPAVPLTSYLAVNLKKNLIFRDDIVTLRMRYPL